MNSSTLMLFAPESSRPMAAQIAQRLGVEVAPLEERGFEDGEFKLRPLIEVRGADVYLLHSLAGTTGLSVNDQLARLLFAVGAIRDAGAAAVTAILPYLSYARKDRRSKPLDPLTTRYLAQLLEAMGLTRVVALDVHNLAAFQNAFRCPAEHLEARWLFVDWIQRELAGQPLTVVSPDSGGFKRALRLREALERSLDQQIPMAIMEKQRSAGVVSGSALAGELEGRAALIVDDLVSSGTTLMRAAEACRSRGAKAVVAAVTHGVFSKNAAGVLGGDALDRLLITDSVSPRPAGTEPAGKLVRLTVMPLLAEAIRRLHGGGSLVELVEHGAGGL